MPNANILQAAAYLRRAAEDFRAEIQRKMNEKSSLESQVHNEVRSKEALRNREIIGSMSADNKDTQRGRIERAEFLKHEVDRERQNAAAKVREIDGIISQIQGKMNDLLRRASDLEGHA